MSLDLPAAPPFAAPTASCCPVALTRTSSGWTVVSTAGNDPADDLVEGMSLADLVLEEFGGSVDPDRSARRSARGPQPPASAGEDPRDVRLAELERTVAQLEHALAARVSTERAIGVLAERHGLTPRDAFEQLRQAARSQGRPVAELAREVLDTLTVPATVPADGDTPRAVEPPAASEVPPRPPTLVNGTDQRRLAVNGHERPSLAVERRS